MSGSKNYVASTGIRYPKDPKRWDDDSAPKKAVEAGGDVDEFAVKQSPWLIEQGKVTVRRGSGLVVDEAVKAKVSGKAVKS